MLGATLARADEQGRMRIPQGRGQFLELAPPTPVADTVVYETRTRATRLEPVAESTRCIHLKRLHLQRAK